MNAAVYSRRFDKEALAIKTNLWKMLIYVFIQRFVKTSDIILDIGGGTGEFINNVSGSKKYLVDINPECRNAIKLDVEYLCSNVVNGIDLVAEAVNVVFARNFFEHLDSAESLLKVLDEARRVLKHDGRIIIIQPNIKYAYKEYWDFIDHKLPVSDKSLVEALELSGFKL